MVIFATLTLDESGKIRYNIFILVEIIRAHIPSLNDNINNNIVLIIVPYNVPLNDIFAWFMACKDDAIGAWI